MCKKIPFNMISLLFNFLARIFANLFMKFFQDKILSKNFEFTSSFATRIRYRIINLNYDKQLIIQVNKQYKTKRFDSNFSSIFWSILSIKTNKSYKYIERLIENELVNDGTLK